MEQEKAFALWLSKAWPRANGWHGWRICARASVRELESVVGCIIFVYMKIFVWFAQQPCLLRWYMPMLIAEWLACIIFHCKKKIVCFIKQAGLLAIISNLEGGLTVAFYGWASLKKNARWKDCGFSMKKRRAFICSVVERGFLICNCNF
jgi:hypothetical protein